MIELSFHGTDQRVAAALQARGARLEQFVGRALVISLLELQARVQRKLSGEVLKHRTGKAVASVRLDPVRKEGMTLRGGVLAGGGVVWWLVVHERGGLNTYEIVPVNKRALAFFPEGSEGAGLGRTAMTKLRFAMGHRRGELRPTKFSDAAAAGLLLRRKVIHPPLPQRSFMRSSLVELQSKIVSRIFQAAAEALR